MNKYQNGKIYKLVNTEGTLTYIGSTTQTLAKRKSNHHESYKCWKNGKSSYVTSFKIFDVDEENCQIVLLEAYPCDSKIELEKRERHYIETIECINKYRPTRSDKEYYEDNKEKIQRFQKQYREDNKDKFQVYEKQYREDNKEKMQEFQKQYRKDNQEYFMEYKKQYYGDNKDKIQQRSHQYYEANKETIQQYKNEKHQCVCGGKYTTTTKARNFKSIKHINYMNSIKNENDELEKLEKEFNEI